MLQALFSSARNVFSGDYRSFCQFTPWGRWLYISTLCFLYGRYILLKQISAGLINLVKNDHKPNGITTTKSWQRTSSVIAIHNAWDPWSVSLPSCSSHCSLNFPCIHSSLLTWCCRGSTAIKQDYNIFNKLNICLPPHHQR